MKSNGHARIAATVPGFNPSYIMPNDISLEQGFAAMHQCVVGTSQWATFIYQNLVQNKQAETMEQAYLATGMRETSSQVGRLIERLDAIEQRREDVSNEVATLKKDFNAFRDRLRNA
jgi:heme oxygenase